jgi:hypothetical protein
MRSSPRDSTAFGASAWQLVLGRFAMDEDGDKGKQGSPWTAAAQQRQLTAMMGNL